MVLRYHHSVSHTHGNESGTATKPRSRNKNHKNECSQWPAYCDPPFGNNSFWPEPCYSRDECWGRKHCACHTVGCITTMAAGPCQASRRCTIKLGVAIKCMPKHQHVSFCSSLPIKKKMAAAVDIEPTSLGPEAQCLSH